MAEFIFVHSDVEHPTAEERYFLLRHIGHDFRECDYSIASHSGSLVRNQCKDNRLVQKVQRIHHLSHNVTKVHLAMQILNSGGRSDRTESSETYLRLQKSLQELFPHIDWLLQISLHPKIEINKSGPIVWLQLLNFSQNAAKHAYNSRERIEKDIALITLDQLTLSPKELAYLGRNQHQYTPQDRFIKASVQDFGQGIAPERLPHIIPRTEELTIDPYRRTGLSLTDYVCDYLHGFVKVESELGKGSTFSLYFPQKYKPRMITKELELPFKRTE